LDFSLKATHPQKEDSPLNKMKVLDAYRSHLYKPLEESITEYYEASGQAVDLKLVAALIDIIDLESTDFFEKVTFFGHIPDSPKKK